MLLYLVIIVVIVLFVYFLITFNSFVRLNNKVKEAFSTMDVYLKKRWDLIPNIVETVKGYAKHEKDTLEEVVKLRGKAYDDMSSEDKINSNVNLNEKIVKIMALAEAYPELKADKHFLDLSKQLSKVEDEIAQSRKYYNATVRVFNNKVEMFPSNVVAGMLGYKVKSMYEASLDERDNVMVNL